MRINVTAIENVAADMARCMVQDISKREFSSYYRSKKDLNRMISALMTLAWAMEDSPDYPQI